MIKNKTTQEPTIKLETMKNSVGLGTINASSGGREKEIDLKSGINY